MISLQAVVRFSIPGLGRGLRILDHFFLFLKTPKLSNHFSDIFTCNFADITARTPSECCWKSRVSKTVPKWAGFLTNNSIFFCRNSFNSLKFPWVDKVLTFITKFSIAAEDILFWLIFHFSFFFLFSLACKSVTRDLTQIGSVIIFSIKAKKEKHFVLSESEKNHKSQMKIIKEII